MFGIVGIPVTEIALAAQEVGIRYVGMRNEQAVSYGSWGDELGKRSMTVVIKKFARLSAFLELDTRLSFNNSC